LDGIGFLGTDCKRVATTDLRVLQDTPTRWLLHLGPLDVHRDKGIMEPLNPHMETTKYRTTWNWQCNIIGKTMQGNSKWGRGCVSELHRKNITNRQHRTAHHSRVETIIKWNQEHLDAYLQSADIIIEQRDEPG
jgi:hypothetical protein